MVLLYGFGISSLRKHEKKYANYLLFCYKTLQDDKKYNVHIANHQSERKLNFQSAKKKTERCSRFCLFLWYKYIYFCCRLWIIILSHVLERVSSPLAIKTTICNAIYVYLRKYSKMPWSEKGSWFQNFAIIMTCHAKLLVIRIRQISKKEISLDEIYSPALRPYRFLCAIFNNLP